MNNLFFYFHICPQCTAKIDSINLKNFHRYVYTAVSCPSCFKTFYFKLMLDEPKTQFLIFPQELVNISYVRRHFSFDEWEILEKYFDFYVGLSSGSIKPVTFKQKQFISVATESSSPTEDFEMIWLRYIHIFTHFSYMAYLSFTHEHIDHLLLETSKLNQTKDDELAKFSLLNEELTEITHELRSALKIKDKALDDLRDVLTNERRSNEEGRLNQTISKLKMELKAIKAELEFEKTKINIDKTATSCASMSIHSSCQACGMKLEFCRCSG